MSRAIPLPPPLFLPGLHTGNLMPEKKREGRGRMRRVFSSSRNSKSMEEKKRCGAASDRHTLSHRQLAAEGG